MGFRIVTATDSITFENDQELFILGTVDEESWITYECDTFIIEENREKRDFDITIKEQDGTMNYSLIKAVCEDMKELRKDLDRLMNTRLDVFTNFRYANRHVY